MEAIFAKNEVLQKKSLVLTLHVDDVGDAVAVALVVLHEAGVIALAVLGDGVQPQAASGIDDVVAAAAATATAAAVEPALLPAVEEPGLLVAVAHGPAREGQRLPRGRVPSRAQRGHANRNWNGGEERNWQTLAQVAKSSTWSTLPNVCDNKIGLVSWVNSRGWVDEGFIFAMFCIVESIEAHLSLAGFV